MSRYALSAVAVLVLAAAPIVAFGQTFGPKDIQEAWVGKTLTGATGAGRSFLMKFSPDGTIEISGDAANDTGTWRLTDSGYCATWKKIRAGAERCFTTVRQTNGEFKVSNPDGSVAALISKVE